MASVLTNPERLVGFHFFNPVAVMPLLEVVRAARRPRTRPSSRPSPSRRP
ncbi:3-hydroxyacyl-CoA dehydrogenase NAD-binding domain-containing protein [Curtobacterium flaccumfaciens pv. flaccumfaciens]|nr:3-hydroxyacyl-CoA dehydrogenase NAD-binding domain-containing protein [Curtobacterium flaccumfaciens]MCS6585839.1 3-hydroxyacyl-CoA dehydrogenase NAD-binding domain-containing protein [Curtobacterium flaccumfaciens pv. flaccumfaciens]